MAEGDQALPVVGITGHGGSYKSTLATTLGADLGPEPNQVVPTDCFYTTKCGPDAGMWEQHDWAPPSIETPPLTMARTVSTAAKPLTAATSAAMRTR